MSLKSLKYNICLTLKKKMKKVKQTLQTSFVPL